MKNRAGHRIPEFQWGAERLRRSMGKGSPADGRNFPEGFAAPQSKKSTFSFLAPRSVEEFLAARAAWELQQAPEVMEPSQVEAGVMKTAANRLRLELLGRALMRSMRSRVPDGPASPCRHMYVSAPFARPAANPPDWRYAGTPRSIQRMPGSSPHGGGNARRRAADAAFADAVRTCRVRPAQVPQGIPALASR